MDFKDLHLEACMECGQSEVMLKQVKLNDRIEREGQEEFTQDNFKNCLERAITIYMPYFDENNAVHVKYANLYALCIANHRSEIHSEDRVDEIEEYKGVVFSGFEDAEKMVELGTRRWWAG